MAWRVARSLDVLLEQLDRRFPTRNTASDGSIGDTAHAARTSDHNPDSGGVVRARDFTHDPAHDVDIGWLSDQLAASRDPRIRYVIANNLIMSGAAGPQPWQWRAYTGTNPHRRHLHLSVVADSRADDPRPWALPMLDLEDEMPTPAEFWAHLITNLHGQPVHAYDILSWTERRVAGVAAELAGLRALMAQLLAEHADDLDPDDLVARFTAAAKTALADAVITVDVDVTRPDPAPLP